MLNMSREGAWSPFRAFFSPCPAFVNQCFSLPVHFPCPSAHSMLSTTCWRVYSLAFQSHAKVSTQVLLWTLHVTSNSCCEKSSGRTQWPPSSRPVCNPRGHQLQSSWPAPFQGSCQEIFHRAIGSLSTQHMLLTPGCPSRDNHIGSHWTYSALLRDQI